MKRTTQILWGVLCAGVLLMGAGTGMAFATYAGFQYDADTLVMKANPTQEKMTVDLPEAGEIEVWTYACGLVDVVYDKSVPEDELRLVLEYDPAYTDVDVPTRQEDGVFYVDICPIYAQDDFQLFMENKDAILQALKDGVLMQYDSGDLYRIDVTMRLNPANKDRLFT